ncbi:acyl-CoA thioesterase [Smaragdicoccus niigatensis]|uniref:acyl-CoA thioesterase n=1 Tax=Smaragdicoccus niigatensis TaxID=359359 RepID=UPI00039B6011|nr:thioesterase family protein [Smaragdicoccus niigatensis]
MIEDQTRGFLAKVEVRWSDMDAFNHINNARMVTILEEARIPWLFSAGKPTLALAKGCVVADLRVRYRGQLHHDHSPLQILMWVEKIRAVDFTIRYEVRPWGAPLSDRPAVVASSQVAAMDLQAQRLRRLTEPEREYLKSWMR